MPGVRFECVFDEVELWAEKDPRDAQTSGGMTEGLSFDMTTVPKGAPIDVRFAPHPYHEFWYWPVIDEGHRDYVYVVYWHESGIVKAGCASNRPRWRRFCVRGAELLALFPGSNVYLESEIAKRFAELGRPAFGSKAEGFEHVGNAGGHFECYVLDLDSVRAVLAEFGGER
jgi:hypothetical protein